MLPRTTYSRSLLVAVVVAAGLVCTSGLAWAQSATAVPGAVIKVNTGEDESNADGDCSLREAIEAANTNSRVDGCKAGSATERDGIRFALGKEARIVLGSALPPIADPAGLGISGRKASITISGNEQVGVFEVAAGADLRLANLTVADGDTDADVDGGGLMNRGTAKVRNTTFSNNSADSGGGISNRGTLEVTNSAFSNNSSINFGGGISNSGSTLKVTNSTFSKNSTVSDGAGGGIFNNFGSTLEVTNSTFSENSSEGGGGIFNNFNGTLEVTNSTFSKNSAEDGGGIFNNFNGTLRVTNSTFSENSAVFDGGGIFNNFNGTLEATNSTFSENSASEDGGGIFDNGGTTTLRNTIVAYSSSGGNCSGTIADGGYNIDDGATCGFTEQQNSLPNTDPLLAEEPANNGGPTETIALLKGSPAINAIPKGENGCDTDIRTDQRGVKRPQGKGCDVGSYEKKRR